jgi:ribose-phosphate pyrophosphokinase
MRTKPRDPVTSRYVARLIEAAGAQRMLTLDVHNRAAYENSFRIPIEHLTAAPLLANALLPWLGQGSVVVVSLPVECSLMTGADASFETVN